MVICLEFVNTVNWAGEGAIRRDRLASYPDYLDWAWEAGLLDEAGRDALRGEAAADPELRRRALGQAWTLRHAMHGVLRAAARGTGLPLPAVARLNAAFQQHVPPIQLDAGGDAIALTTPVRAHADPLTPVVRATALFLASPQLERLRECAGAACGRLYLDTSRNRTRRWCDMGTCGNRAKAARHRRRVRRDPRSAA
jgi:predicted RNA-binding Zn ribbon-like protein